jgi:hypothetical protein
MSRKQKKTNRTATVAPVAKSVKKPSAKRIVVICVCAFLATVIIVGAALGIATAVKRSGYVMEYGSVGVDEGVARYLASYYKTQYLSNMASGGALVSDTEQFWSEYIFGENTHGIYLQHLFKDYMSQLVAANYIFDTYTKLTADDKKVIDTAVSEILDYKAQGSVSTFNENTKKFGFDFDDFRKATEMIYKGWSAKVKILGENGEGAVAYTGLCDAYLNNYSHVYLTFIRTETTFVLDENGNRVKDENGNDKLRNLTDEELLLRQEAIGLMQNAAVGIEDGEVSYERYFELMNLYNEGDRNSHSKGYYFKEGTEYTKEFSEAFAEVVSAAISMPIGMVEEVDCSIGKCFIYKTYVEGGAYTDTRSGWCFSDFYAFAADSIYKQLLSEHGTLVTYKDKWALIDPVAIPKNTDYIARF